MTPSDAPPVLLPPKFKLPRYALLLWFPGAAVLAWFSYAAAAGDPAYRFGSAMGGMLASLLFPMLLSWGAWRLSGRSGKGHGLVFLAVLALLILGQVVERRNKTSAQQAAANAQLQQVVKDNEKDLRATLDKGEAVSAAQSEQTVKRTQEGIQKMIDQSSGDDQRQGLAMQAFVRHLQEVQQRYIAASNALETDTFFQLERAATAEARAKMLAGVEKFQAAITELRQVIDEAEVNLAAELKKQQVSAAGTRGVLAGYHNSTKGRLPLLGKIRDKDEALAAIMIDYLHFAEKYEGRWSRNPQTKALVLPDDAAVQEFNHLVEQAQKVHADQIELQKEILAPR